MTNTKKREELLNNETVRQQIADRAYFLSESHGFAPGREVEFWLTAEDEIISGLLSSDSAGTVTKTVKKATTKAAPTTAGSNGGAPKAPAKKATKAASAEKAPAKAAKAAAKPAAKKAAKKSS